MKRSAVLCSLVVSGFVAAGVCAQADSTEPASNPVPTMQAAGAKLQAGDAAGAAEMFEAIHTANPQNGQAWFMHGYAVHVQGN